MQTRRAFLSAALALGGAPLIARLGHAGEAAPVLYAAARREADGSYAAVLFTETGDRTRLALPARGHDLTCRPGTRDCVVFARRPGAFAAVLNTDGARPLLWFAASQGRHFNGHGVFSRDGRLLYSTETDMTGEKSRGVIGIRDAAAGYRRIGEVASGGMDPHDIALLGDGRTLVVANGGIETDPETGRLPLNLASMEPSLVYVDLRSGDIIERHSLGRSLHQLSIRHLAVMKGDLVVFGCQYEGPAGDLPPLVGFHRRGSDPVLVGAPGDIQPQLKNYIGSVAADRSGTVAAASAPKGGTILFWDAESRRYLGSRRLEDGCGLAEGRSAGAFLLTSGAGAVVEHHPLAGTDRQATPPEWTSVSWDNHAIAISDG